MAINSQEIYTADNQDPETKCAGGKAFDDCETAVELFERNKGYRMNPDRSTADGNYVHLLDDKMLCKAKACGSICHIALEIVELEPSGHAKIYCEPAGEL